MPETAKLARSAVGWSVAFNLYRDVLQFATMLVLVRLMEPAAYGQFAQTTAIVGFVAVFSFNNFIAWTLQPKDIEAADWQVQFTAGAVLQGFAFVLTNVVAFAVAASGTTYAAIAGPMHVASFGFLLEWACELRRKMLEREFRWRRLNVLHAAGITLTSIVGLVLGVAGFGVYALIGPGMLQTVPFVWDLFVVAKWRPDGSWSRSRYAAAWRFALKRTGSSVAVTGRGMIEATVMSGALGFQLLGVFNRAQGLMQLLCARPAWLLGNAVYPLLPRLAAEPDRRSRAGDLMLRVTGWIVVPSAVAAGMLAEPIVATLYGERWLGVVPLLPWAMAYGAVAALVHSSNLLLVAGQRVGAGLLVDLFALCATVLGLWLTLSSGVTAYLAFLFAALAVLLALLVGALGKASLASARGLFDAIGAPLVASAAAGGLAWALMPTYVRGDVPGSIGYALAWSAIFGIVFLLVVRLLFAKALRELVVHLPGKRAAARVLALRDVH